MRPLVTIRAWLSRHLGLTVGLIAATVIVIVLAIDIVGSTPSAGPASAAVIELPVSTHTLIQPLAVLGAVLILAGFAASQAGRLNVTSLPYLIVNASGAATLCAVAGIRQLWGFVLLEAMWALVSLVGLCRRLNHRRKAKPGTATPAKSARRAGRQPSPGRRGGFDVTEPAGRCSYLALTDPAAATREGGWRQPRWHAVLPPSRRAHLAGDELNNTGRVIHLFRDSYAAAQGRQWLQPHILAWAFKFLRQQEIPLDWNLLTSPELAAAVTSLNLPPGHPKVQPASQTTANFKLWWSIFIDLAHHNHHGWARHPSSIPDTAQLESRAWTCHLRPWMSGATTEELAGLARSLEFHRHQDPRGRMNPDELMVRVLLPGLLLTELHWLHTPAGLRRTNHHSTIFEQHYQAAHDKHRNRHYLTPIQHMYLRAGDILHHLQSQPHPPGAPHLHQILTLHDHLKLAHAGPTPLHPPAGTGQPRPPVPKSDPPQRDLRRRWPEPNSSNRPPKHNEPTASPQD